MSTGSGCSAKAHIANHYIHASIDGALKQGYSAEELLDAAGIPRPWLNKPEHCITEQQLSQLIKAVWRKTRDEFMGLAHRRCKNGVFALMAEMAQQADTLGGMLKQSARFYNAVYEGMDIGPMDFDQTNKLHPTSSQLFYRLQLNDQSLDQDHLLQEFLLLMWQRFACWLTGQQIPFANTHFNYPEPEHVSEYHVMFTGELCFNQPICGFSLHPRFLQLPIIRTHSELTGFLKESPAYILHRPDQDDRLHTRIRCILQQFDFDQMPDLETISQQLHLTPRTLRRKLKDEGYTLRSIKEGLRKDYAIKLLTAGQLNVAEISTRTGFSESAAFCRAFKRWTGQSPSDWRNE